MNIRTSVLAVALLFATALSSTLAQSPAPKAEGPSAADEAREREALMKKLGAQTSGIGKIGARAEMDVPEGYIFFPSHGTQQLLKQWGNLVGGNEDGLIMNDAKGWSVVFEFEDVGYVKDDEKSDLDAGKMLKQMHDSEPALNEARKEAGLPAQHTVGFAMPPKYNEQTHNLEWATKFTIEGEKGEFLNYHTKLLGRKGVMTATLMVEPSGLEQALPDYQKVLTGYRFNGGETYAEYRSGDKVATYGLIGLVAGGAALAAGKAGLFSKLGVLIAKGGKAVILAVAAVFGAIAKLFGKLFGRRDNSTLQE